MKKKLFLLTMVSALTLTMVACGEKEIVNVPNATDSTIEYVENEEVVESTEETVETEEVTGAGEEVVESIETEEVEVEVETEEAVEPEVTEESVVEEVVEPTEIPEEVKPSEEIITVIPTSEPTVEPTPEPVVEKVGPLGETASECANEFARFWGVTIEEFYNICSVEEIWAVEQAYCDYYGINHMDDIFLFEDMDKFTEALVYNNFLYLEFDIRAAKYKGLSEKDEGYYGIVDAGYDPYFEPFYDKDINSFADKKLTGTHEVDTGITLYVKHFTSVKDAEVYCRVTNDWGMSDGRAFNKLLQEGVIKRCW